tara:strand:+ start:827 stop:1156 length:330 start_codon:yes stop_codon:yes gene_type:complete
MKILLGTILMSTVILGIIVIFTIIFTSCDIERKINRAQNNCKTMCKKAVSDKIEEIKELFDKTCISKEEIENMLDNLDLETDQDIQEQETLYNRDANIETDLNIPKYYP